MNAFFCREEWARKFAMIQSEMTGPEVIALVGPPEAVRSQSEEIARYEPNAAYNPGGPVQRVWAYGVGEGGLPTLGQVWFNRAGVVSRVYGHSPASSDLAEFEEIEIRGVLQLLDYSPGLYGWTFDPKRMVKVVNGLHRLGNFRIVTAIREYLRIAPLSICVNHTYSGLAPVLRILFPRVCCPQQSQFGDRQRANGIASDLFPYFPIALLHDVPLLLTSDYALAGSISIQDELENARTTNLRAVPLTPAIQPVDSWNKLWTTLATEHFMFDENLVQTSLYRMIVNQIARLVENVFPIGEVPERMAHGVTLTMLWENMEKNLAHIRMKWDQSGNQYLLDSPYGENARF